MNCEPVIGSETLLCSLSTTTVLQSAITDSNGEYELTGIAAGDYCVGIAENKCIYKIEPLSQDTSGFNFVLQPDLTMLSVDEIPSPTLPEVYSLEQYYPNPFNPETRIEFALQCASFVTIDVYNIVGKRVRNLVSERLSGGRKVVTWNGRDDNGQRDSSGVYFYRIITEDFTEAKKMVLLK